MFCLVAQAELRVPATAGLRTELSFPRQKMGRAAGSVQTPKTLLATPCNSPELMKLQAKAVLRRRAARPSYLQQSDWRAGLKFKLWKAVGFSQSKLALVPLGIKGSHMGCPRPQSVEYV